MVKVSYLRSQNPCALAFAALAVPIYAQLPAVNMQPVDLGNGTTVINIKACGATGNGSTDDKSAITSAIRVALAAGAAPHSD